MRTNEKTAATLAAATRKLNTALADAARETWRIAAADRRIATQEAGAIATAARPTILAADCEIARYNG